ncbi:glycosyltransferase family 2 protein, partial [Naematelia encephala]
LLIIFTPISPRSLPIENQYTTTPTSTPRPLPTLTIDQAECELSVIVPAFNEEDRLGVMVDEAMEYLLDPRSQIGVIIEKSNEKVDVEIIVVDDGSSDGTTRIARELAAKWAKITGARNVEIRVVKMLNNVGKGGTVQHGVLHARGKYILFADADGATRFSDIALLLNAMKDVRDEQGHGMVVGSRAHLVTSEAVVKRSKLRNMLMHGFHLFLRTLGVRGIRDTQCGFKLFTRQTAALLFPTLHLSRWSFDVELLLLATLISPPIPVKEVPVVWHEVNGSKIRLGWDSIGMMRDLLVLRGNLFVGRWIVPTRQVIRKDKGNDSEPAKHGDGDDELR